VKESLADKLKDGVPTEDKVADILAAINPLFTYTTQNYFRFTFCNFNYSFIK
jgi:hypothetical protein